VQEVKVHSHICGRTITDIHHDVVMVQERKAKDYWMAQARSYKCANSMRRIQIIMVMQFELHPMGKRKLWCHI